MYGAFDRRVPSDTSAIMSHVHKLQKWLFLGGFALGGGRDGEFGGGDERRCEDVV